MYWLNLGKWNHSSNRLFTMYRIYWFSYKWTPFVKVKFRNSFSEQVAYLLPWKIVYWCVIRAAAEFTIKNPKTTPDDATAPAILKFICDFKLNNSTHI